MTTDTPKFHGRLPNLKNDVMFKAIFVRNQKVLREFLNSVLELEGAQQIESLEVLNPDLPRVFVGERGAFLDLRAVAQNKEQFHVEMQASAQPFYAERSMFYWSKLYSQQLKQGESFLRSHKIYSLHIVNFDLFQGFKEYRTDFGVFSFDRSKNIRLTPHLEIVFAELGKLPRTIAPLKASLKEVWLYLVKNAEHLSSEEVQEMSHRTESLKEAVYELEKMNGDPELRELVEMREEAERRWRTEVEEAEMRSREREQRLKIQLEEIERQKQEELALARKEAQQKTREIALRLLAKGLEPQVVAESTELSLDEVLQLQRGSS